VTISSKESIVFESQGLGSQKGYFGFGDTWAECGDRSPAGAPCWVGLWCLCMQLQALNNTGSASVGKHGCIIQCIFHAHSLHTCVILRWRLISFSNHTIVIMMMVGLSGPPACSFSSRRA
jgi:hypothetical protein